MIKFVNVKNSRIEGNSGKVTVSGSFEQDGRRVTVSGSTVIGPGTVTVEKVVQAAKEQGTFVRLEDVE